MESCLKIVQINIVRIMEISRIKNVLHHSTTLKLIHAFVTSRMDYCHSLLFDLSHEIRKIQIIPYSAARIVTKTRKYGHIASYCRKCTGINALKLSLFTSLIKLFAVLHQHT